MRVVSQPSIFARVSKSRGSAGQFFWPDNGAGPGQLKVWQIFVLDAVADDRTRFHFVGESVEMAPTPEPALG